MFSLFCLRAILFLKNTVHLKMLINTNLMFWLIVIKKLMLQLILLFIIFSFLSP